VSKFNYSGNELELFDKAQNWKQYWSKSIKNYVIGDVLEIGAGIGANVDLFINKSHSLWLAVEPDPNLSLFIKRKFLNKEKYSQCKISTGTIKQVDPSYKFDTALYIDVLEHIEFDALELRMASERIKIGGSIIVIAPAHNYLFSVFDKKIGHQRRYSKKIMRSIAPKNFMVEKLFYIDSAGFFVSLVNKLFLCSEQPTPNQIFFWDKVLIPISKIFDKLTLNHFGKTVICIMTKRI
jgi:hypothetical protein